MPSPSSLAVAQILQRSEWPMKSICHFKLYRVECPPCGAALTKNGYRDLFRRVGKASPSPYGDSGWLAVAMYLYSAV